MKIKTIFYTLLFLLFTTSLFAAQATLSWDMNSEEDLAGYKIYYGNTTSRDYDLTLTVDVKNVTSYTITGLVEGEIYFFAATAYDFSGNESGYSNEVSYNVPITSDDTPPVIVMLGEESITIERGLPYIDAGATATDNLEGDVTDKIIVDNAVNSEVEGTYLVIYTVTDTFGNMATATRTVIVEDTIAPDWNGELKMGSNGFSWNSPEGETVAYYKVYKQSSRFPNQTDVFITTTTSFGISGKNEEQEYTVSWVSEPSGIESRVSSPLCVAIKGKKKIKQIIC